MNSTIQHYYFRDLSSYSKNVRLNISIDELNSRQTGNHKDSLTVVSKDDAATIEISELARAMYGTSVNAAAKQENDPAVHDPAAEFVTESETKSEAESTAESEKIRTGHQNEASYAGLSGAEREIKELEDYIASHPADTSIDLLRNGSLVRQAGNAVNLDHESLIAAEKEYLEAFTGAAEHFADFSMKITYGDYSGNDVSVEDLNFDALDQMEALYWHYKEKIQSGYHADEKTKYLNKLDKAYNAVFEEKIINPVKGAYDDKLTFFKPDSEETMKSIRAASVSKESLNEMVAGYVANQSLHKQQYTTLTDGTKNFYNMADDHSLWHNTEAIKSILTDSMHVYSSVKEIKPDHAAYLSAKSAADNIAKKISDQYAENLAYKAEKLGFKKDGDDSEWSNMPQAALTNPSSGMFMIDFSKIIELSSLIA